MSGVEADDPLVRGLRERTRALPEWLRGHTARVVVETRRLAQRYEVDPIRAQAAAWGHDLYRSHGDGELLQLAGDLGLPVSDLERAAPLLLHGPLAAAMAEREWGIDDAEVLEAIRWHTTARPGLSPLALTVFLADKIEPAKVEADAGLIPIRALAESDPEAALLAFLDHQLGQILSAGQVLHPASVEARNAVLIALRARAQAGP